MGKSDKKAKSAFSNAEEAKAKIQELKDKLGLAKEERKTFGKDNGLSGKPEKFEENAANAKHGKKWKAMTAEIEKTRAEIETAESWLKENKPKKSAVVRDTKYEYPEGLSDLDKKKFRAKKRAEAKAGEKAEKKAAKGGDEKTKKSATPKAEAEAAAAAKSDKKKKKAKKED